MATFAQLKTRAQNLALNDDDTEAGLHVNDALTDIVVGAQLKVTMVSKPLAQGKSTYDISSDWSISDFGALQYLEYLGLGSTYSYILEPISADEILALNATNPIGATRQYAFMGLDQIRLWPTPQQGLVTNGTSATIANNTLTATTSLTGNAIAITNVASIGGGLYDITTSSPHGYTGGESAFIVIPSTSNGFALTNTAFTVVSTTSPSIFRISSTATVSAGAATGYVGSAASYSIQGIGSYSGTYTALTTPSGTLYAYAASGSFSSSTCSIYSSNDTLKVYYAQSPAELVDDSDVPTDIPSQWHWLIAIAAAARLADAVGEDQNLSNALDVKFQAGMDRFQKWLGRRQGRTAKRIQTGYLRNPRRPFHDPSTYYSFSQRQH